MRGESYLAYVYNVSHNLIKCTMMHRMLLNYVLVQNTEDKPEWYVKYVLIFMSNGNL